MKFDYCPQCGEKLIGKIIGDEGDVPFCSECGRPFFAFSYPCVICLCINEYDEAVLIRQSYGRDRFICVAGYIKEGESAEDAAKREIMEEIGLETTDVDFLYSKYFEKHDDLMLAFRCGVKKAEFRLSGEVKEAKWFTLQEAEETLFEGSYGKDMIRFMINGKKEGRPV